MFWRHRLLILKTHNGAFNFRILSAITKIAKMMSARKLRAFRIHVSSAIAKSAKIKAT